MESNYSIDSLQELLKLILSGKKDEQDLYKFLETYSNFDYENDFIDYLEITYVLLNTILINNINNFSPIIKILNNNIQNNIILFLSNLDNIKNNKCCNNEKEKKVKDCNKSPNEQEDPIQFFKDKYSNYKGDKAILNLPNPGEIGKVSVIDNKTFPGREFSINFFIDHEGQFVDFDGEPMENLPIEKPDFKEIYNGLLGKIMDYQK